MCIRDSDTSAQPIFHKNFDLVSSTFTDYLEQGYTLYICTDSEKQAKRLKDIFEERGDKIAFTPDVYKRQVSSRTILEWKEMIS